MQTKDKGSLKRSSGDDSDEEDDDEEEDEEDAPLPGTVTALFSSITLNRKYHV